MAPWIIPFAVRSPVTGIDRVAVETIGDDIVCFDQFRCAGARQQVFFRIVGVTKADMAVCINHFLMGEYVVCDHDVAKCFGAGGHVEFPFKHDQHSTLSRAGTRSCRLP